MTTQSEDRMRDPLEIEAIVGSVLGNGNNRFAVTHTAAATPLPRGTNVTFSLTVWEGGSEPRKGQVVMLGGIERFAKGWRASRARPITLTIASQKP